MIIPIATRPSRELARLIASRHDDGGRPLRQYWYRGQLQITRADGSELSALEQAHVRAAISALKGTT
jgi:hypothetical protein